jgi:hypothetical protein
MGIVLRTADIYYRLVNGIIIDRYFWLQSNAFALPGAVEEVVEFLMEL